MSLTLTYRQAADELNSDPADVERLVVVGRLTPVRLQEDERITTAALTAYIEAGAPGLRRVPQTLDGLLTEVERADAGRLRGDATDAGTLAARRPGRFKTAGDLLAAWQAVDAIKTTLSRRLLEERHAQTMVTSRHLCESAETFRAIRAQVAADLVQRWLPVDRTQQAAAQRVERVLTILL